MENKRIFRRQYLLFISYFRSTRIISLTLRATWLPIIVIIPPIILFRLLYPKINVLTSCLWCLTVTLRVFKKRIEVCRLPDLTRGGRVVSVRINVLNSLFWFDTFILPPFDFLPLFLAQIIPCMGVIYVYRDRLTGLTHVFTPPINRVVLNLRLTWL